MHLRSVASRFLGWALFLALAAGAAFPQSEKPPGGPSDATPAPPATHPFPHPKGLTRTWVFAGDIGGARRMSWYVERLQRERTVDGVPVVEGVVEMITPAGAGHAMDAVQQARRWVWEKDGFVYESQAKPTEELTPAQMTGGAGEIPVAPEVGREWTWKRPDGSTLIRIEGRETVETPAGTYRDCWKVVWRVLEAPGKTFAPDQAPIAEIYWYAPGVGGVRVQQFDAARNRLVNERVLAAEHTPLTPEEDVRAQKWFAEKMGK